jgi:hypothetical protein
MIPPQLVIKVLLLVPSVIFIFYGAIYAILSEIKIQPNLTKFYRKASFVLLGGGVTLLVTYLMI